MKKTSDRGIWVAGALLAVLTAVPLAATAQDARTPPRDRAVHPHVELAQDERERPRKKGAEPGIWDIPKDDLALGLVIAALIGAAAGHVYARIVRPRK